MSDIGHNDPAAARALEGIREYQAGIIKEQAGRDDAIAGIIKYGAGLIEGRGQRSDRAFGEWVREKNLDVVPPFNDRQERAAAQQIATISSDGSGPVRSFAGCPHSRPVDVMKWWREKYPEWLTEAYANEVRERAAILLRDHRDRLIERDQRFDGKGTHVTGWLEALARDPFAVLVADRRYRTYERALSNIEIDFGLRPAPPQPDPQKPAAAPPPVQVAPAPPVPLSAPNAASAAPDRIQRAADSAEIATLRGRDPQAVLDSLRRSLVIALQACERRLLIGFSFAPETHRRPMFASTADASMVVKFPKRTRGADLPGGRQAFRPPRFHSGDGLEGGAMTRALAALALLPLVILLAPPAWADSGIMPDPTITPGAVRTTDVGEICSTPTSRLRHWSRDRDDRIMLEYGLPTGAHPQYEVDHLIPLCLGGADDDANSWPEPRRSIERQWNAERKDELEARACALVCTNAIDVHEAQQAIAEDWIAAYQRYVGAK